MTAPTFFVANAIACGCETRGSGEVPLHMAETFGARLRQRREQQQITLATIAEQTKIKVALLEGLERDDISHWPVGIFRRAFIRSYAHAIGLEPTTVLRDFLALHPDELDVVPEASTVLAGFAAFGMVGIEFFRMRKVVKQAA